MRVCGINEGKARTSHRSPVTSPSVACLNKAYTLSLSSLLADLPEAGVKVLTDSAASSNIF